MVGALLLSRWVRIATGREVPFCTRMRLKEDNVPAFYVLDDSIVVGLLLLVGQQHAEHGWGELVRLWGRVEVRALILRRIRVGHKLGGKNTELSGIVLQLVWHVIRRHSRSLVARHSETLSLLGCASSALLL